MPKQVFLLVIDCVNLANAFSPGHATGGPKGCCMSNPKSNSILEDPQRRCSQAA